MSRRIELIKEAAADLEEIARYTQDHWGAAQRVIYLTTLRRKPDQLAETPRMGMPRDEILPGHRSLRHGSHIVLYQETSDGILVSRIVHGSMELKRRLAGPDEPP